MTDTRVRHLLETLAETAPEPSQDLVGAVHQDTRRRIAPPRSRGRLVPALVAVATVVAVLLAVGVVALTNGSRQPTPPAVAPVESGVAAREAATRFAQIFFSPDYRTIDDYNRRVIDASTGTFRTDFASKQGELAQLVTKARSIARGEVLAAAPREVTPTTAKVLIAADQRVENTLTQGKPEVLRVRAAATLRLVDGHWQVEGFEPRTGGPGDCADPTVTDDVNELLRQSCAAAERLFSFDYRTIDADLAAQRAVGTGSFQDEISRISSPAVIPLARKEHARVTATVSDAAIAQQTPTTASVLAFVNQDVENDQVTTPRIDRNRVELTMSKVEGRWLVSGVRAL